MAAEMTDWSPPRASSERAASLEECWAAAKSLASRLAEVPAAGVEAHRVRLARAHALALSDVLAELLLAE
jgi:hypothetical protein